MCNKPWVHNRSVMMYSQYRPSLTVINPVVYQLEKYYINRDITSLFIPPPQSLDLGGITFWPSVLPSSFIFSSIKQIIWNLYTRSGFKERKAKFDFRCHLFRSGVMALFTLAIIPFFHIFFLSWKESYYMSRSFFKIL